MLLTNEILNAHNCFEPSDRVSKDPESTYFRRRTRLHQSLWRESKGFPIGTQPIKPKKDQQARLLGSRIDLEFARESLGNFLSDITKQAVLSRINNPEPKQTLYEDRLFADLLSSMPMCFNLFGPINQNLELSNDAINYWWPDAPGKVSSIRFEWSPGRQIPGKYLENRSAFDVAFIIDLDNGKKGLLGIETKYHEYCQKEPMPSEKRINRYKYVASETGLFSDKTIKNILGSPLQQIWLDHLLALSMLVDNSGKWDWVKFVLVFPSKNPSYRKVAKEYSTQFNSHPSFEFRSVESLLDNPNYPSSAREEFRTRYIW